MGPNHREGSETIPQGSTPEKVEAVNISASNVGDEDIVQKSKVFSKYLEKCSQMFNNKYDYSKFKYKSAKTKSIIVCPIHGEFFQNMDKHTAKNSKGCAQCWNDNRPYPFWFKRKEIVPFVIFKEKANKIFQNLYEYDEQSYIGMSQKSKILCKVHGVVEILPQNFFKSAVGCPKCGEEQRSINRTKSYLNFVNKAILIHNNKYEYPNIDILYKNRKSVIEINCPKHGVFNKKAQKHLSGQGCFKCKIEALVKNNILIGAYSEVLFSKKPELKNIPAFLYLMKINHYYKVGITTRDIKNRVRGLKSKAKSFSEEINVEVLKCTSDNLYNCFLLEQKILQENEEERIFKKWSTELLKHIDIDKYF